MKESNVRVLTAFLNILHEYVTLHDLQQAYFKTKNKGLLGECIDLEKKLQEENKALQEWIRNCLHDPCKQPDEVEVHDDSSFVLRGLENYSGEEDGI